MYGLIPLLKNIYLPHSENFHGRKAINLFLLVTFSRDEGTQKEQFILLFPYCYIVN